MADITSSLFCTGDLQVTKSADANSFYQGRIVWNDPEGNEYSSIEVSSEITTGSFDVDVSNLGLNGLRVRTLNTGTDNDRYGLKLAGQLTTLQGLRVQQLTSSTLSQSEALIVTQNTLAPAAIDAMQVRRNVYPGNANLRIMKDTFGNNSGYLGFNIADDNSAANSLVLGYRKKNAANFNGTDNLGLALSMNGLVGVAQDFYSGHNVEAGLKCVSFNRVNTQFLTLPASSLTFATTGVTFIAIVKFTGDPGSYERVFEFATGSNGNNSFSISRYSTNATLQCMAYNGTTQVGLIADVGNIVQDQWTVLAAVYNNTSTTLDLYQNGVLIGTTVCAAAVTDKTSSSSSYLGRSTFSANSYSNYQVAGLFVYNAKLTAVQIATVTLANYDVQPFTYTPTYSYIGSRLRFKHNESVTYWDGAYQTTAARQPSASVLGLLYDSTGLTLDSNTLRVDTSNKLVGVGILPQYKLDVAGDTNITGAYKISGANVLTNTTLGSSVVNSSLTSVGTLANLTVSGAISGGTLSLQTIANTTTPNVLYYDTTTKAVSYGAASTPSLLPITLDTVNNRVGINNTTPTTALDVAGTITGTNLAGTLTTAAQPNITSLGTLTTLTVSGDVTVSTINATSLTGYRLNSSVFLSSRSSGAVGLGSGVHNDVPGTSAVAIGLNAGQNTHGTNTVAVGVNAGRYTQGTSAVAVGNGAGAGTSTAGTGQGSSAVAVGVSAGSNTQGANSVAVGNAAGQTTQAMNAVAIGMNAGNTGQGADAVAIGRTAGLTNQHANSIILNATGSAVNSDGASRFFVKPVRNNTTATSLLQYDATSGEITYGPSNIAGTLTTAAQPNITSVGTLGSLSVTGATSAGTLSLQSIANTSTSNVLYYDTTSKAVSYGASPTFAESSLASNITIPAGTPTTIFSVSLSPGTYIFTTTLVLQQQPSTGVEITLGYGTTKLGGYLSLGGCPLIETTTYTFNLVSSQTLTLTIGISVNSNTMLTSYNSTETKWSYVKIQ